jgi:hypothetical protein
MFGRGGKDLDLTTPRAKSWTPNSTTTRPPAPSATVQDARPVSIRVRTGPTVAERIQPASTVSAADEGRVIAKFSAMGILQVMFAVAIVLFLIGLIVTWLSEGMVLMALVFGVVILFAAAGTLISAVLGLFNILKRGGQAVWISGDRLLAIDPFHGMVNIGLDEFEAARFEPRLKSGKSYRRAIVLTRQGGAPKAFGVGHLDQPYANVLSRIAEAKAGNH